MELKDGINKNFFKKSIDKTNIWYIITISNKSSKNEEEKSWEKIQKERKHWKWQ